jgi:hypothetical protein
MALIRGKTSGWPPAPAAARARSGQPGCPRPAGNRRVAARRAWPAVVLAAVLAAGCAGTHAAPRQAAALWSPAPALSGPAAARAGSLVRVPRPDYASAASIAAAFYVAWGSVDAVHDGPMAFAARCAPLVTGSLGEQLAASQLATAAWQVMRRDRLVSLVRVGAVTRPDGAPAPTSSAAYLRVYARRVTVTTAGRTTASDGVTLRLTRVSGRWLVAAVLFY